MPVRVQMGKLPSGDYGLRVVSSDGTTVIIDGTSNMFKIAASGTTSVTQATKTQGYAAVTLTGLGSLAATPAHVTYLADDTLSSSERYLGSGWHAAGLRFVALTSGGAVTHDVYIPQFRSTAYTLLNGSSECVHRIALHNSDSISRTVYGTYYIFQEAAM